MPSEDTLNYWAHRLLVSAPPFLTPFIILATGSRRDVNR